MSSLMFLFLLGSAICKTYCVSSSACSTGDLLTISDLPAKTFQDGDILNFNEAFEIKFEQLQKIAEIHQVGDSITAAKVVTITFSGAKSIEQHLLIEGTTLAAKGSAADDKITFKDLEMIGDKVGLDKDGSNGDFAVVKLTVGDLTTVTDAIKPKLNEVHATIKIWSL